MASAGVKCIKWLVFIFNFIFFLMGGGLIALGVYLNVEYDDWKEVSDYDYISVANVAIAAGVVVVIVAGAGCWGAMAQNKCMLMAFFVLLVVIFALEIGAGTAAYVWRGELEENLLEQIKKRVPGRYYGKEEGVRKSVDAIQDWGNCCGVNSAMDYFKNPLTEISDRPDYVPESCCQDKFQIDGTCRREPNWLASLAKKSNYNWDTGCYDSIKKFLKDNLLYVGICGIVFGLFQVMGMVFSMVLICAIRKDD